MCKSLAKSGQKKPKNWCIFISRLLRDKTNSCEHHELYIYTVNKRTWVDDLRDWTGSKRYNEIKRAAEKRDLHGAFPNSNPQHLLALVAMFCRVAA